MNILGLDISWGKKSGAISIDTLLRRLEAVYETHAGVQVTPENCMQSPTVHAIVTAISSRIATLPVHVLQKSESNGQTTKERLPSHPVQKLLDRPNEWQSRTSYWLDATSWLVRYGNFYAFKARGQTGPIRQLTPLHPAKVEPKQQDDLSVVYNVTLHDGENREFAPAQLHHVRGPARDGVKGDSPVMDVRETIALEIAAERMGATVFGNGAMPGLIFEFLEGSKGFKTDEERTKFVEDFQAAYGGKRGRMKAMLMPQGIKVGQQLTVENEKAQFLETRKYQRNIIAGAFGVPPHLVGDLEKGTYNNVEQQSLDFVTGSVLPRVRIFEAAMERDLLTNEDRARGVVIRFNLDGALRADFKTRQEGMNIMRQAGVLSANDWREREGLNPISDSDGGNEYWRQGPSGQSADAGGDNSAGNDDDQN